MIATSESQTRAVQSVNAPAKAPVRFEPDVLPIFQAQCVQCHGSAVSTKALNLSTYRATMKGGESGAAIVPGKPDESRLYKLIQEGKMPFGGKPLPDTQVRIIRAWIEAGAPSSSETPAVADEPHTQHDVLPILFLRCTVCHGSRHQEGGLDLHTREAMLKGGQSGPAIIPGKPDESLLIKDPRRRDGSEEAVAGSEYQADHASGDGKAGALDRAGSSRGQPEAGCGGDRA